MINYFIKTVKDKEIIKLADFQSGCLIYVHNPSENEINFLKEKFFLDTNLLKDALDVYEIPRIEIKDGFKYIFLRIPVKLFTSEIATRPFLCVIASNFFLLFSKDKLEFLEKFINRADFYTTQRNKLFFYLLYLLCQNYNYEIINISKAVRKLGLKVKEIKEKDIENFVKYEITHQNFMAALVPIKYIFNDLLQKGYLEMFDEDKDLIEDLILKINQLEDLSKANIKNIIHIREAFEIILQNKVNKAIKALTALTIIFAVPTLIASLYGMNISLPLEDNPYAFSIIIAINLFILIILVYLFKKVDWF